MAKMSDAVSAKQDILDDGPISIDAALQVVVVCLPAIFVVALRTGLATPRMCRPKRAASPPEACVPRQPLITLRQPRDYVA